MSRVWFYLARNHSLLQVSELTPRGSNFVRPLTIYDDESRADPKKGMVIHLRGVRY